MKKLIKMAALTAAAVVLAGCASAPKSEGGAKGSAYKMKAGDGVIGYYTFDEDEIVDNEVVDHSPAQTNIYTGALDGSVLADGKTGNGLVFNGEDEYLVIEPELLDNEGFTFAAWVNPTAWRDWARVFDIGDGATCDCWCGMDFETKMMRMDIFGPKGEPVKILAPLPPVGKWTHIAAVVDNTSAALYVNGKLSQKLPNGNGAQALAATVNGIYIGRSNWAADPLFNGVMDEVVVANRAMTKDEIAALANGIVVEE